jgi:PAS domain S-box-containing protein
MKDEDKTKEQLINELVEIRKRITALETTEIHLKKAEEALWESEERYRTLFEESRDALYITTPEGKFVNANQAMLTLFGYRGEEMQGMNAREIYLHPFDRNRFQQEIEQKGFVRNYEAKFQKKDGTVMDCLLTAVARHSRHGKILEYQGIMRDITEQRRAEERTKKLNEELNR